VLGSTPETRDLVLKHGGELTSIDISMEMILKTDKFLTSKDKDKNKETIIRGDWLKNPTQDGYFDVVLGDGVLNNVSIDDQSRFLEKINRILKPGGYMILREGSVKSDKKKKTVEELNADYVDGRIHWFDLFVSLYCYSDLTDRCFDKEKHKWYQAKIFNEIENAYLEGRLSKKAVDAMWWFKNNLTHTFLPRFDLIEFMQKYFRLISIEQAKDYEFCESLMSFYFGKVKK